MIFKSRKGYPGNVEKEVASVCKVVDKNENGKSCIDVIIIQSQLQWNMLLVAATDRAMDLP